jgi:FkbM family methyltransferase
VEAASRAAALFPVQLKSAIKRRLPPKSELVAGTLMRVPRDHPVLWHQRKQPNRHQPIARTAAALGARDQQRPFVDIGANIGDTAAVMAANARNPLILVEPSDEFHPLLVHNAQSLPSVRAIHRILVADRPGVTGTLTHWGGTAALTEGPSAARSMLLSEIAPADTAFVKIDTDGFDYRIINGALDWLQTVRPVVMWEVDVRSEADVTDADSVVANLAEIGYARFLVWDDPGDLLTQTDDPAVVKALHRYLLRQHLSGAPRIYNYDVLAIPRGQEDLAEAILGPAVLGENGRDAAGVSGNASRPAKSATATPAVINAGS